MSGLERIRAGRGPHAPAFIGRLLAALVRRDRALPVGVAILVLVASFLSVAPAVATRGGTGAVSGAGQGQQILAIGGASSGQSSDVNGAGLPGNPTDAAPSGPYLSDGTLLKPLAVDTSVAASRTQLRYYTVQSGDTLTGIANHFGISMMTLWWANHLSAKDELHIGQRLVIPPVDGLVVTVASGDSIESLAAKYGISTASIIAANDLSDPTLIIGQLLMLPGAHGAAIPNPTPAPTTSSSRSTTTTTTVRPPTTYRGGRFIWPVVGGGNYISQYFWSGHPAIDIAAQWGTPVVAAAAGTVIWAGWRDNGGGYQVWIAHGSGLYTTYNHMSAITVGSGQYVSGGRQVGRIGMTGNATGPHLHFEVWIGPVWNGGYRVNPMAYF